MECIPLVTKVEREDAMESFVYYNKDNKNWSVKYKEVDPGSTHIKYSIIDNFPTEETAKIVCQAKTEKYHNDIERLKKITNVKYTLSTYITYWFEEIFTKRTTSKGYYNTIKWTVEKIIIPSIDDDPLISRITSDNVNSILKKCNSLPYVTSGSMAKKVFSLVIKSAVAENVITRFDLEELDSYPDPPPRYIQYSKEDLKILLAEARKTRTNYLEILLCLLAGLRIGEVRGLTFSNIDFKNHTITICQQITDDIKLYSDGHSGPISNYIKPPKSLSSYRTLKVPTAIIDELHYRQEYNQHYFECNNFDTKWKDYICIGKNGLIKSSGTVTEACKRICRSCGLPIITCHGLRHMCATILLESGMEIIDISHILGHKSASTTFDIYCGEMSGRNSIRDFLENQLDPIYNFHNREDILDECKEFRKASS